MRPPPTPTLQDVLISHPTATATATTTAATTTAANALTRPDELVAAAVMAADDAHDLRNNTRPRSMLARVTRRWSRFSDTLWRRRSVPSAADDRRRATAAVLAAATANNNISNAPLPSPPVRPAIKPGVAGDSADDPPPPMSQQYIRNIHNSDAQRPQQQQQTNPNSRFVRQQQPRQYPQIAYNNDQSQQENERHQQQQQRHPPQQLSRHQSEHQSTQSSVLHQSHAILRRERELRLLRDAKPPAPPRGNTPTRGTNPPSSVPRRVRQVGARDDDDTLLQLPRISSPSSGIDPAAPVSVPNLRWRTTSPAYSSPYVSGAIPPQVVPVGGAAPSAQPQRVRQLPRVSGLMPVRPPAKPKVQGSTTGSGGSDGSGGTGGQGAGGGSPLANGRGVKRDHAQRLAELASPVSSAGKTSSTASSSSHRRHKALLTRGSTSGGGSAGSSSDASVGRVSDGARESLGSLDDDRLSQRERFECASDDGGGSFGYDDDDNIEDSVDVDDEKIVPETWDVSRFPEKRKLCRLPTALLNKNVDQEVEHAVVEIASDSGDSEDDIDNRIEESIIEEPLQRVEEEERKGSGLRSALGRADETNDELTTSTLTSATTSTQQRRVSIRTKQTSTLSSPLRAGRMQRVAGRVSLSITRSTDEIELPKVRSRSDAHNDLCASMDGSSLRRASSIMQDGRRMNSSDGVVGSKEHVGKGFSRFGRPSPFVLGMNIASATAAATASPSIKGHRGQQQQQDVALFEDDYLSFQGFNNGQSNRMTGLLRSTRISSVTDSHSEDSDEIGASANGAAGDVRRRGRNGRMPVLRMMRSMGLAEEARR